MKTMSAPKGKVPQAVDWLKELLSKGARQAVDVESRATKFDFSATTLKRARKILKVVSRRCSTPDGKPGSGYWEWALPGGKAEEKLVKAVKKIKEARRDQTQHRKAANVAGVTCLAILDRIRGASFGLTCDDLEAQLGLTHQNCSARVHELEKSGKIKASGTRRKTRSGRTARVFVLA